MIIGGHLSLANFGLYNIAFFLASFPFMLGGMVMRRLLIPIYRESPPLASAANFARLRKMRVAATGALSVMTMILAFSGIWLVQIMYDDRYAMAGGIVVLIAVIQMPALIMMTCDQAALAMGDSRRFFVLTLVRAVFVVTGMLIGLQSAGLIGALVGQGLANVAAYPVLVWLIARHGAWDPAHDATFAIFGVVFGGLALWLNWGAVAAVAGLQAG